MNRSNKVLIGILIGIGLIVLAGFMIAVQWQEPQYRPGESAEDVVYNYLLAVQKEDYQRAYGYLDPYAKDFPSRISFEQYNYKWMPSNRGRGSFEIEIIEQDALAAKAVVHIVNTYGGSFFDTDYSSSDYRIEMRKVRGNWRLTSFSRCYDC